MENLKNDIIVETMYAITDKKLIPTFPGIYYFKNLENNKYYIGQAENIKKRHTHHLTCLRNGKLLHIYSAIRKYGIEKFEYGIIEVYDEPITNELKDLLDDREKYFIKLFDSYGTGGYNETIGGNAGVRGLKMTDEQKKKISENSKKNANDGRFKIYCYNIDTKEILIANNINELSEILNETINYHKSYIVHNNKYILARNESDLNMKIEKYNINNYKLLTKEQYDDLLQGMNYVIYSSKYNVSQKTYYNHKKQVEESVGYKISSKRYNSNLDIIDWEEVEDYYNQYGNKKTTNKYNISSITLMRKLQLLHKDN